MARQGQCVPAKHDYGQTGARSDKPEEIRQTWAKLFVQRIDGLCQDQTHCVKI